MGTNLGNVLKKYDLRNDQYESIGWFDRDVVFVKCFDKTGGYVDRNGVAFFE